MIRLDTNSKGVATITFNRPEKRNAFNAEFIKTLISALKKVEKEDTIRVLVIKANGDHFCAGADLTWMQQAEGDSLLELLNRLKAFSKPTLALIQGAVMGGGLGIIACCDIVLAEENAFFCFSEAKLGLVPAIIAPFILSVVPLHFAKAYMLTAERFTTVTSAKMGLTHEVYPTFEMVEDRAVTIINELLMNGPEALKLIKLLLGQLATEYNKEKVEQLTLSIFSKMHTSSEGKEGVNAFLEKRRPDWRE